MKVLSFIGGEGRHLKWIVKDVEQFEQAREYVDTGVIPLLSISAAKEMKTVVEQGEFIELLSMELEREYKGRVLLLPAFTYLVESQKMKKVVCKNGQIIYKSKVLSILLMLQVIFHGKKICKNYRGFILVSFVSVRTI